ncbi:MAG: VCBS repeat-containing protein, partial [Bacteroidales bacterium]|nr:VCBS repeat-containing protein [Bacteroidales bacterium]
MKNLITLLLCFIATLQLFSQSWQKASISDDFSMISSTISAPLADSYPKSNIQQLAGFPVAVVGNPTFKNMRGLALADINNDNISDIVFATHNCIYAYTYQGLLWQKSLTGTAIYPPTVGDINNDGFPEIIQTT